MIFLWPSLMPRCKTGLKLLADHLVHVEKEMHDLRKIGLGTVDGPQVTVVESPWGSSVNSAVLWASNGSMKCIANTTL